MRLRHDAFCRLAWPRARRGAGAPPVVAAHVRLTAHPSSLSDQSERSSTRSTLAGLRFGLPTVRRNGGRALRRSPACCRCRRPRRRHHHRRRRYRGRCLSVIDPATADDTAVTPRRLAWPVPTHCRRQPAERRPSAGAVLPGAGPGVGGSGSAWGRLPRTGIRVQAAEGRDPSRRPAKGLPRADREGPTPESARHGPGNLKGRTESRTVRRIRRRGRGRPALRRGRPARRTRIRFGTLGPTRKRVGTVAHRRVPVWDAGTRICCNQVDVSLGPSLQDLSARPAPRSGCAAGVGGRAATSRRAKRDSRQQISSRRAQEQRIRGAKGPRSRPAAEEQQGSKGQ
jgi:hypothetical protein